MNAEVNGMPTGGVHGALSPPGGAPRPRFSILTPVYNGAAYLEPLLASVQAQTFRDFEHLLVDDGSTDHDATLAILRRHAHLAWWSRENRGQYASQNELIQRARGEIVTVICADDLYAGPETLRLVAACFDRYPGTEVVYGRTLILRFSEHATFTFDPHAPPWLAFRLLRYCPTVQHGSLFVRRDFLLRHGLLFDPRLKVRGDWDWILRIAATAARIRTVNVPLAYWRHHAEQTSRKGQELMRQETRLVCEKHHLSYAALQVGSALWGKYGLCVAAAALWRQQGARAMLQRLRRRIGSARPRPPAKPDTSHAARD